jgi:tetratricopeptide (TPR) repeat protein
VELLLRQDAERPDDPITLYHLGQVYQQLGRPAQALPVLRRSLERLPPDYSIRPRLFVSIARAHEALGQRAEAMAVTRAGRGQYPDAVELLFLEAARLYEKGDLARAEERLLHLLSMPPDRQLTTGDTGRQGYKARHLLAQVYRGQGRVAEAEAQWRSIIEKHPRFLPARHELGGLYLTQGQWRELEEVAASLTPANELEAALLLARAHLARREFSPARALLEKAIGLAPEAVWPRLLLSRVILQEGRDMAAAEEALRAVLALDPNQKEARNNLEVRLGQQKSGRGILKRLDEAIDPGAHS